MFRSLQAYSQSREAPKERINLNLGARRDKIQPDGRPELGGADLSAAARHSDRRLPTGCRAIHSPVRSFAADWSSRPNFEMGSSWRRKAAVLDLGCPRAASDDDGARWTKQMAPKEKWPAVDGDESTTCASNKWAP